MLSLNPEKLLVVLVVALVLLGPDKLPRLARQLGAGWRQLREFQQRVEREVRETMPDLPSTQQIAGMARSPARFLNSLANMDDEPLVPDPGAPGGPVAATPPAAPAPRPAPIVAPDDPSMN
jgi:sec-independent protein translocase protein TatB